MSLSPFVSSESESIDLAPSNFRGGRNATQNIRSRDGRISFRDLARFVYGKQSAAIIAEQLDNDIRTVKRWYARGARAPDRAVMLLLGEITRRYG